MKIPFSLPVINQDVIDEVIDCLTNTGWLTTGPKTKELEKEFELLTKAEAVICVNSWTSGAMLMLRWFGVKAGDEVIVPAYTYSATALCVMNIGAIPVMVDVDDDFNINVANIKNAITPKTKAIIPVDIGGWPCDYDAIMALVNEKEITSLFKPEVNVQQKLGRILVISDAAHSIGAKYKGSITGTATDITVFSLHSVKNITTGEGGAICINLPKPFNNKNTLQYLRYLSLNGQNKSAFEKSKVGGWRYDIVDQGLKVNMPDICAAVGLAQIKVYKDKLLPERKDIFEYYNDYFSNFEWANLPPSINSMRESSYHLYMLRVNDINEDQRDQMIEYISSKEVAVNVHYIPMSMLTLFKNKGYKIEDYPNTYSLYANEISLPIYNNLSKIQLEKITNTIREAYNSLTSTHE
ncbi:MAG: DegT/DnrJ/EryC1/StrS family aminotransferase [Flavobacteriaceae bacterium]|nr:DegT/DnrJ/EryC1/StrS family aminotransferase [Flavobacteriaceae bacterium]